ncbi:hypothetical protein G6F66_014183 [Rhizopus arrhizus]|nr:hypothetical protein G6F66_014183 [Rhizopus arrhizus]
MRPALTDIAYKRTASWGSYRFTDGNPELKPTYAKQWEIGLEKYLDNGALFAASYFRKNIDGVPQWHLRFRRLPACECQGFLPGRWR